MEIWKDVREFEGMYQVSNLGRIKSLARRTKCRVNVMKNIPEIIRRLEKHPLGYLGITLVKNNKRYPRKIHRMVAQAFIDNPHGYREVNHIDGDKENNRVENLEWCDRSHNIKHAYKNGLIDRRGENGTCVTLTKEQVIKIREMKGRINMSAVGRLYGVSCNCIRNVLLKNTWQNV